MSDSLMNMRVVDDQTVAWLVTHHETKNTKCWLLINFTERWLTLGRRGARQQGAEQEHQAGGGKVRLLPGGHPGERYLVVRRRETDK